MRTKKWFCTSLFILIFTVMGCANTISVSNEELESLTKQWREPKISIWYYRGSDDDYHYLTYEDLGIQRKYRIKTDELDIENPFSLKKNRTGWRTMSWGVHAVNKEESGAIYHNPK